MTDPETIRAVMKELAARGGRVRSLRKTEAARRNASKPRKRQPAKKVTVALP